MNGKSRQGNLAAFGAALSIGVLVGPAKHAWALCEGASILQDVQRKTHFFGATNGTNSIGRGGGAFSMDRLDGGFVDLMHDGLYGLRNNETGLAAKIAYYPGDGKLRVRACRIGITSESFTCTSYEEKDTTFSSLSLTSLTVDLDAIADYTNAIDDTYAIHGWSPEEFSVGPGITSYPGEKGLRAITAVLGKNPSWETNLGAGIDSCIDPVCW